jgi:hypothetical protein
MAQSAGQLSRSVVDTGIGPVLTLADLVDKCTCMIFAFTLLHGVGATVCSVSDFFALCKCFLSCVVALVTNSQVLWVVVGGLVGSGLAMVFWCGSPMGECSCWLYWLFIKDKRFQNVYFIM